MARSSPKPSKDDVQKERFIEAACQLGADEDEAAFKAKLAQIARQKPTIPMPLHENDAAKRKTRKAQ